MRIESIVRRPWIVFLLAFANIIFIVVLSAAGTGAGYYGVFGSPSPSTRLRMLYILNVQTPRLSSNDWGVTTTGWTGYLFVNNACVGPTNGESPGSKGAVGASCQQSRIAQRYFISTKPNLTGEYGLDPQLICYKQGPHHSSTGDLYCNLDEEAAWPRYLVSLTAPGALILLGTVGTVLTLLLRFTCLRRRLPRRHLIDIVISALSTFFFSIAAILLTSDAIDVRDWVNGQHAPLVYDAQLGLGFFVLLWLTLAFTSTNMAILILAYFVKNRKVTVAPEGEEPPGYDAVTTQVRILPQNEMATRR